MHSQDCIYLTLSLLEDPNAWSQRAGESFEKYAYIQQQAALDKFLALRH